MDVTSATAGTTTVKNSDVKTQISSDFQTFLSLLTTQISNQDPMDPMKAEEFAVQLATFSSVEQQVQTNELLSAMIGASNGEDFAAATGWIGREVKAKMPLHFDGDAISLAPERPLAGNEHHLVLRDAAGVEIDRQRIPGDGTPLDYTGRRGAGDDVPAGLYAFSVESFESGELVATEPVAGYGQVEEVRLSPSGPVLALAGGAEVPAAEVSAVRALAGGA